MNRFSRRRLFGALSAFSLLALARCAATGTGTTTATVSSGLALSGTLAAALIQIVNDISAPPIAIISTSTANAATADLTAAEAGITVLEGLVTTPAPANASTWQLIATLIEDAATDAEPLLNVLSPGAGTAVGLAIDAYNGVMALLPTFEAAITPAPVAAIAVRQARLARHPRPMVAMNQTQAMAAITTYLASKGK